MQELLRPALTIHEYLRVTDWAPAQVFTEGPHVTSVIESFGEMNFANADLGDARRTRRLVATARCDAAKTGRLAASEAETTPKDLRAFYRLMNCDEVTHEAILEPHREAVFDKIVKRKSPVLILHDATELDFTSHLSLKDDLGQIGNGGRRGYIVSKQFGGRSQNATSVGAVQPDLASPGNGS